MRPAASGEVAGYESGSDHAGNQQVKHGDDAGRGGSEDQAFEAGFVEVVILIHLS